jgi:hypothetical protein
VVHGGNGLEVEITNLFVKVSDSGLGFALEVVVEAWVISVVANGGN